MLLQANEHGANLVNIAQIFQRSGTVLVSFAETGIVDANDIVLKRIGYWPNGSEFEVYALTFHIGSDPSAGSTCCWLSSLFMWVRCLRASWMPRRR